MSKAIVDEIYLYDIAREIRSKLEVPTLYKVSEMADAIEQISNFPVPTETISINATGTYDVSHYATAEVSVPGGPSGTIEITQNGTYDVYNYANAKVTVGGLRANTAVDFDFAAFYKKIKAYSNTATRE